MPRSNNRVESCALCLTARATMEVDAIRRHFIQDWAIYAFSGLGYLNVICEEDTVRRLPSDKRFFEKTILIRIR